MQAVLQLWRRNAVLEICSQQANRIYPRLIPALFRGGIPHWNPTVNKMVGLVLTKLEECDPSAFIKAGEGLIGNALPNDQVTRTNVPNELCSRQYGSGPALGKTGIWTSTDPPMLTKDTCSSSSLSEHPTLASYMSAISGAQTAEVSSKDWELALSEPVPTFLPDLRFHSLVFGRELGVGGGGRVLYARAVRKGSGLSNWAEYAIKEIGIMSVSVSHEDKITGPPNRKPSSILRELACLLSLSHPGVTRLVSFYRLPGRVHLCMEFCSRGDLWSYVRSNGRLSESVAQRVIGEIAGALQVIHSNGWIFGDVKPENCLITSDRKIKLTDFGAARIASAGFRDKIDLSSTSLTDIRWGLELRPNQVPEPNPFHLVNAEDLIAADEGEGTDAYLPPEVRDGQDANWSFSVDSWGLGRLGGYLLLGRLPPDGWLKDDEDISERATVVKFANDSGAPKLHDLSSECTLFFKHLLDTNPETRLSMNAVCSEPWMQTLGELSVLYQKPVPADHLAGRSGPAVIDKEEEQWSKRQLSKIWSKQVAPYRFDSIALDDFLAWPPIPQDDVVEEW